MDENKWRYTKCWLCMGNLLGRYLASNVGIGFCQFVLLSIDDNHLVQGLGNVS